MVPARRLAIAVFWVIVLMFLFSWPTSGNISWPFMLGAVVLLVDLLLRLGARPSRGHA